MRLNRQTWTGIVVVVPLALASLWIGGYPPFSWVSPTNPAEEARTLQDEFVKELAKTMRLKKKIMEKLRERDSKKI